MPRYRSRRQRCHPGRRNAAAHTEHRPQKPGTVHVTKALCALRNHFPIWISRADSERMVPVAIRFAPNPRVTGIPVWLIGCDRRAVSGRSGILYAAWSALRQPPVTYGAPIAGRCGVKDRQALRTCTVRAPIVRDRPQRFCPCRCITEDRGDHRDVVTCDTLWSLRKRHITTPVTRATNGLTLRSA